jgi:hypothetical protein
MSELKFPTEIVELPSKGLVYPETNPLSSGKVEMRYMTAKSEDILTNQNFIKQGIVLEKLLESLIVSKHINVKDLIVGDKNALLVAARILGYGGEYTFTSDGETHTVDLSKIDNKEIDESLFVKGKNEFTFTLPHSKNVITFKLITGHDEELLDKELEGLKKISKNNVPELSTRLKYMITSINDNKEEKAIREFVDEYLLAIDSRSLRTYIRQIQPDVDLTYTTDNGEEVIIPINLTFFWPDSN